MTRIRVEDLSKRFRRAGGSEVLAVDDLSFSVGASEFVVLLGPSGCGKTTLLRCIAGLEHPDRGLIEINGRVVMSSDARVTLPPERRGISMMFQSYALWPHMTVAENVAYPLRARGRLGSRRVGAREINDRVLEVLARVRCETLADQHPGSISGGQQQRVALARALVANGSIVLFDEPLSNVDAKVREELRLELISLQRQLGFSAVYVTHDQTEALALADRIVLLREGRVAQAGSPAEVYRHPGSRYVANFLGTINEVPGTVARANEPCIISTAVGALSASGSPAEPRAGDDVVAAWRPEACTLHDAEPDAINAMRATVSTVLFMGSHREYLLDVDGHPVRAWQMHGPAAVEGAELWLTIDPADVHVFPQES